jgi:outer membrane protein W
MKKVLITIGLITNLLNHNTAQIIKGSWMLDGGLHYNQNTCYDNWFGVIERTDLTNAHLNGTVGYFLTDKLAWGVNAGFDVIKQRTEATGFLPFRSSNNSRENYHISPFVRYYFNPKSNFKTFYELSVGSNWDRSERAYFRSSETPIVRDHFYLNVKNALGANYFLTQNLALEASISYNYFNYINEKELAFSYEVRKVTFNPKFGIKVFLNTPKQDTKILAAKYLRKGNMTIGLTATKEVGAFDYSAIDPSIGYFLTNKWLIMSSLSFSHNTYWNICSISPELRYYQPISSTTQIFLRGAAILGVLKYHLAPNLPRPNHSLEAGIGLNRFITENVGIQGSVSLNTESGDLTTGFSVNTKVGFQYFINR